MNFFRLVSRSLQFHASKHFAVLLGVMAATAVLTGALVVGDSVRFSLRHLTLDRLRRIDHLLLVDRFFRAELASELQQNFGSSGEIAAVPAIIMPTATAEVPREKGRSLAAGVTLIAADQGFWDLNGSEGESAKIIAPKPGEVLLNEPLASELNAKVGDTLIVRIPKATQVSEDSPLGRKDDRLTSLAELKVREIIPAEGLGRFSLHPMQTSPRNVYVALAPLQETLEQPGKVNAILVATQDERRLKPAALTAKLQAALRPTLADYGLSLKHVTLNFEQDGKEEPILNYFSLSTNRMLLDETTERVALEAFKKFDAYPVLTYLANSIDKVGAPEGTKGIPYSTIAALDPAPDGPLVDREGKPLPKLADDEIALTDWAAEDQGLKIGDKVRVTFFEPETTHGAEKEESAEFTVKAIIPLTEPTAPYSRRKGPQFQQRPTKANDADLTPDVPGVTDQASIADWDAPFPFDYKKIRAQDDKYWNNHRTTPKAYISLAAGQKLWHSRFGQATSIRIPASPVFTEELLTKAFLAQLQLQNEFLGFELIPIKDRDLAASQGTTPFDVLFLLLSMFIIGAALLLIWLLFRLGVEQRASEIGLLQALGWRQQRTGRWLASEGLVVSILGALLGTAVGIGYAWLMVTGLRTWWVGAISSPFLLLHPSTLSLVIGFVVGVIVAQLTIYFSLRQLRKVSPRQLLAGETSSALANLQSDRALPAWRQALPWMFLVLAAILAGLASVLKAEAQAATFMACGASVLTGLLMLISRQLGGQSRASTTPFRYVLPSLAVRNIGRARGRSMATIALVASACFLVVAVSSFRLSPTEQGVGGFNLLAESAEPILPDLNDPAARQAAMGKDATKLADSLVLPMRMRGGDDASCRNLYQAMQPRVLGVTPAVINHFDLPDVTKFIFAASAAKTPAEQANPWQLLAQPAADGEPVNTVLDMNTALYSLKLYGGIGQEFERDYGDGPPIKFRVVGLLSNSVLQGSLLIGEGDFKRLFPRVSGYRSFLIRTPAAQEREIATVLEERFGDEGFDVTQSKIRLQDLLAVQNTYISTFQALGALGLLLGTFGLAAVQLRNVLERRKELAMLRATGFRAARIAGMVMLENLFLLCGGIFTGLLAALLAVLPHMFLGGASLPWRDLAIMISAILVIGSLVGLLAVRATLKAPILAALRGE
ncbi:FtsX-like permease family protein [Anatilimnocola aggregata]|uniref:FtsX-like permease family protein n=1 Tax=Anatilimnocola aggregata TaxID=2528021 RepID=A0A517Y6D3_9BACT|nr:FtsX-like permease family protein [Anatilimnocola aggregata]QDU25799.1 FtsX-like permease family protein [Anatilimnocola aggregata]